MRKIRIIPRKSWTPAARGGVPLHTPVSMLFVHHTAGPSPIGGRRASSRVEKKLIRATRAFHISGRGMSDIAYNFGVMPSGRMYDLRGIQTGGHTYGFNSNSLAIVSFGNFEVSRPSDEMIRGYITVGRRLRRRKKLTRRFDLRGHREVGAESGGTACPGKFVQDEVPQMQRAMLK